MARPHDERGAVALTVAFATVLLLGAASFALDLGMARVGVRDMQALADVVALDQAKRLDGRTAGELLADPTWSNSLQQSIARNDDTYPDTPAVTATLGRYESGIFTPSASSGVPNAVRVTAASTVDYLLREGSTAVSRSAIGMNDKTACIAVGSYAAQVKGNQSSLIAGLVGNRLGVNVLSYQGLANASVSLLDLAAEFDVGTVDALADVQNVAVGDFYLAIANILRRNGDTVNASLLEGVIRANVSSLPRIDLGSLISMGPTTRAVIEAQMNVLDLVAGAAFVADGQHFTHIPSMTINLNPSGLTSTNLTLTGVKIIQKPVVACGKIGTKAYNSQIDLTFDGTLASVTVPNPGIALARVDGSIRLKVTVALAEGTLSVIDCKQGTVTNPDKVTVDTVTELLRPRLELGLNVAVKAGLIYLPPVPLPVTVQSNSSTASTPVVVNLPPNVQHMAAGASKLEGAAISYGPNSLLSTVLSTITSSVVTPIAKAADSTINGTLHNVVGVDVASADVFAWPRPNCFGSVLVG